MRDCFGHTVFLIDDLLQIVLVPDETGLYQYIRTYHVVDVESSES